MCSTCTALTMYLYDPVSPVIVNAPSVICGTLLRTDNVLESPKSPIFTLPDLASMRLPGLRSRWITGI